MKRIYISAVISLAALSLAGCASAFKTSAFEDDLYAIHDKTEIARRQKAEAELAKTQAEARKAQWEAMLAEANADAAADKYTAAAGGYTAGGGYTAPTTYSSVLADTYESAYARRLYGFESPTYRMPSSYYTLRYTDAYRYATAYDPAFYNVMVSGDQVWVEPKYITSMFGTWGAAVVLPYYYGWYDDWAAPYRYTWWGGYPHYSWYNWTWGWRYNPWWDYGWGYPHRPPYHPYPPHYGDGWHHSGGNVVHRPVYGTLSRPSATPQRPAGSGSSGTIHRGGTTTGSGIYRGNGGSTGRQNSGQYRGSSGSRTQPTASPSYNRGSSGNYSGSHSGGSSSGGYSRGGNSSGTSHGGGQRRR